MTVAVAGMTVIRWSSIPDTVSELKARLVLGLLTQGFALVGIGLILYRYRTGNPLNGPLMTSVFHGLEAMAALLLVAGLAVLVLAAGIALLPTGAILIGLTATELAIGGALMSATGLALMNVSSSNLGTAPGVSPRLSPSQIRVPIPGPLPPMPPKVASAAAAAIVTATADGADQWQPDPAQDPHHYLDANGDLRWRDTDQLVAHNPNRARYIDNNGTERWADTDQPVDTTDTEQTTDEGAGAPPGFESLQSFMDFGDALHHGFAELGIDDASFYLQGSALTDRSHDTGLPFGPESDYDILIISDQLAHRAKQGGLEFRNTGMSRPIDYPDYASQAGLEDLFRDLRDRFGHRASFRIAPTDAIDGLPNGLFVPSRDG